MEKWRRLRMVQMIRSIALIIMMLIVPTGAFAANTAMQVDFLMSGHLQSDGTANAGGKVFTCDAGTVCGPSTSDPKTTWQDSGKVSAETNPVILDSNGKANIYADGLYKFQIYDSDDVLIETIDNVSYVITSGTVQDQETLTPSSQTISATVDTYLCNAQSGAVTTDFSGVSAVGNTGKRFTFKKTDNSLNTCTVDVLSSQTIDGALTAVLRNQYDDITIESDGSNWNEVRGMVFSRAATFHNTTTFYNSATFASGKLLTNTIDEETAGQGVTIDSFKIKDNGIDPTSWPSFRVHLSGRQSSITGIDQLEFDTESDPGWDTNNNFNTTLFRFLPTVAGKYLLTILVSWDSITAADRLQAFVYKNGAQSGGALVEQGPSTITHGLPVTVIVNANGSTDYFEVFAQNVDRDTSSIDDNSYETYFSGSRIAQ